MPDSKDEFPKLLYLDQCKWIDLSRAHYGDPKGEPFRDALASVRKAVDKGRLVVPFSAVHMTEMDSDPYYLERRQRLARFIVDLSQNLSILSFMVVRPWEVHDALYAFFGCDKRLCIRRSLIRTGVGHALGLCYSISGIPAEVAAEVIQEANSAENSVEYLLDRFGNSGSTEQMRAQEAANLPFQERVRARSAAEITPEQRWLAEVMDHLRRGDVGQALTTGLKAIGVSLPDFFDMLPSQGDFEQFFTGVHTLNVELTLTIERDKDLVRKIQMNDARDVIWLSVAIPYSNLVVSEKYWGHRARSCGLDRKYGTTIITDARKIPDHLTRLGCL